MDDPNQHGGFGEGLGMALIYAVFVFQVFVVLLGIPH